MQGQPQDPSAAAAVAALADFSGYWVCDTSRSDAPRPHLASLGLPELAIGAADKLSVALFISHAPGSGDLCITHMSELGSKERRFVLGEEYREPSRDGGSIRFLPEAVAGSPGEIATVVHMMGGACRLAERKVLQPGGQTMVQTLSLAIKGQTGTTNTTRIFARQGDAPPAAPGPAAAAAAGGAAAGVAGAVAGDGGVGGMTF